MKEILLEIINTYTEAKEKILDKLKRPLTYWIIDNNESIESRTNWWSGRKLKLNSDSLEIKIYYEEYDSSSRLEKISAKELWEILTYNNKQRSRNLLITKEDIDVIYQIACYPILELLNLIRNHKEFLISNRMPEVLFEIYEPVEDLIVTPEGDISISVGNFTQIPSMYLDDLEIIEYLSNILNKL